jgi:radical SAM superfamily enzyme YgiQ (UPF0313 family)
MSLIRLSRADRRVDRPHVLLVWPGGLFRPRPNFGVPQLLIMARAIMRQTSARVDIVDLDMERAFGPVDLLRLTTGYDLIGLSCYSSYDALKVDAIARQLRTAHPQSWLVTGGYHVSARPDEFTTPDGPFDHAIVGDGEGPMIALVKALESGRRLLERRLGPDPLSDPSLGMPYDWSLLARYRSVVRKRASEVELYLSRGCPFDCSFCMERAKRDTSWRALEPLGAVEELHRLNEFIDLRGFTLRILDPLFGMQNAWRKTFLEELVRRPVPADKIWLVMRADIIDREDMELMARANVAVGFGLESGDPAQLKRIRKTGKLKDFLEKMLTISEWAAELNVPFGANIIVGHPGETEASLQNTAAYLRRLFLRSSGTHGFVAVDPFRLYPGSPIDEHLDTWIAETGMRVHRYPWWFDGDQDFLSEWIDASHELSYLRTEQLRHELFADILHEIPRRFAYQGPGRDYMMRAPLDELRHISPAARRRRREMHALWSQLNRAAPLAGRASVEQLVQG